MLFYLTGCFIKFISKLVNSTPGSTTPGSTTPGSTPQLM